MRISGGIHVTSDLCLGLELEEAVTLYRLLRLAEITQGMPKDWAQTASEIMAILSEPLYQWIVQPTPGLDLAMADPALHHNTLLQQAVQNAVQDLRMRDNNAEWQCHACCKHAYNRMQYCGHCGTHKAPEDLNG